MKTEKIKRVRKKWGYERWIINTPEYCGKELFIKMGNWSSEGKYHYHKLKDETFYVIKGNLILDYADENDKFYRIKLKTGSAFRIRPNMKHRFSTKSFWGCTFMEFSTEHRDDDSYRCEYINGEWVE